MIYYTDENGVTQPGYFLYASDAENFIYKDGAQYNYGYKEGYFDSIVAEIESVDKTAFADLVANVRKAEALANKALGELENKSTLSSALVSAALNAVDDNMNDYLDELKYYVDGSFMEELDELNIRVAYRDMLRNSVGYMLLVRSGINPGICFDTEDFEKIYNREVIRLENSIKDFLLCGISNE